MSNFNDVFIYTSCKLEAQQWSKANFSCQVISSYGWYSMEKLAGDLLLEPEFSLGILSTSFIDFLYGKLGELRSSSLSLEESLVFSWKVDFTFSLHFDFCDSLPGFWLCPSDIHRNSQSFCLQWTNSGGHIRWTNLAVFWRNSGIKVKLYFEDFFFKETVTCNQPLCWSSFCHLSMGQTGCLFLVQLLINQSYQPLCTRCRYVRY